MDCCDQMGVSLSDAQAEQFMTYLSLLLEWNEKMNLTAITEHRDVVLKHFADCLSLIPHVAWKEGMKVI
ncbi:MAG: class I SAM-dependent methyltransferase, partial [Anaerotignum sp.]|nr:class I SAM-dependent methyltransferase [Anaerotignum sp.]